MILTKIIKKCTNNDVVDLDKLVGELKIKQIEIGESLLPITAKARIVRKNEEIIMAFNSNCSDNEKNTLRAIMLSHGLLYPEKLDGQGITFDAFYLQDMRRCKASRDMLLATNIAIPDSIRVQVGDLRFNGNMYANKACLMPMFVSSSTSDTSVGFILDHYLTI